MIRKLFKGMVAQKEEERQAQLYRNLLRHEARIGGQLFGAVPKNHRREFFCLDRHTWVWHEEWIDNSGQRQTKMTRYDVRPNGVVKSQNGIYTVVDTEEALNLYHATKLYQKRVRTELYSAIA